MGVTSNKSGEARDEAAPGARGQGAAMTAAATMASEGKAPRTARGAKTLRKILDAALAEFGEKGFNDSSVVSITSRAKVALGTFYTYFDSKEALFAALVQDMSAKVREHVAPVFGEASDALDAERRALLAYLDFVGGHKEVYRIIDEAEFVDPAGFRAHYESTAARIAARLHAGAERGEIAPADAFATEVRAWALMGINVFLGLRFGVWGSETPGRVADEASRLVREGLSP
jgi:AcrR family transcriptional regulator